MITIQLLASVSIATLAGYVAAGVATYIAVPTTLRRHHPDWVFVASWPLVWIAYDIARNIHRSVEETDGLQWRDEEPNKWRDETRSENQ